VPHRHREAAIFRQVGLAALHVQLYTLRRMEHHFRVSGDVDCRHAEKHR
jgi:hypothetical protein